MVIGRTVGDTMNSFKSITAGLAVVIAGVFLVDLAHANLLTNSIRNGSSTPRGDVCKSLRERGSGLDLFNAVNMRPPGISDRDWSNKRREFLTSHGASTGLRAALRGGAGSSSLGAKVTYCEMDAGEKVVFDFEGKKHVCFYTCSVFSETQYGDGEWEELKQSCGYRNCMAIGNASSANPSPPVATDMEPNSSNEEPATIDITPDTNSRSSASEPKKSEHRIDFAPSSNVPAVSVSK